MSDQTTDNSIEVRAAAIGQDKGKAAASWVFDGNNTDETYRTVLKGIEEGDPLVLDAYNPPNLSGEYAGDYDQATLLEDLSIQDEDDTEALVTDRDTAANAYNDAAYTAFWEEVERMAREYVTGQREERLKDAGFSVQYAERPAPTPADQSWISCYALSDYEDYDRIAFVDLGDVARGEDRFGQTSTVDRSNFRSLQRDYPDTFTTISYSNTDSLGAFVADLTDELTEELTGLKTDYPLYDESDHSELELEEITESFSQYAGHDMARSLPDDEDNYWVRDQWDAMSEDAQRDMFFGICYDFDIYPEHSGLDVMWREEHYEAIAGEIVRRLSGC